MERGLVACTGIDGLMQTLNVSHIPLDWRLLIDSSKLSLKAVLLHNGKTLPSIPVGHSVHNKESHENMKILMEAINYDKFKWQICGDLKVIALLLGIQQGFTKYCCYICEWDNRVLSLHYSTKDWPARKSLEPGIMNVENQPLVGLSEILFPSIHLKVGLTKKFCKGHEPRRSCLYLLTRKVPQTKWGKVERRYFHWSTNTDLIKDEYLDKLLQGDENAVWDSFKFVVEGFLGNRRAQNYEELVSNILQSYQKLGCNMSLKYTSSTRIWIFPRDLWFSEWWTRRTFPSRHFLNGEEISREMELCYARRLLQEFGKWCPYHGTQATGKTKKKHDFVCVK